MLKVGMLGMGGISRSHYTSWKQIPEADASKPGGADPPRSPRKHMSDRKSVGRERV